MMTPTMETLPPKAQLMEVRKTEDLSNQSIQNQLR
jgi:hypothetical protein